jgi:hypothetical protein
MLISIELSHDTICRQSKSVLQTFDFAVRRLVEGRGEIFGRATFKSPITLPLTLPSPTTGRGCAIRVGFWWLGSPER